MGGHGVGIQRVCVVGTPSREQTVPLAPSSSVLMCFGSARVPKQYCAVTRCVQERVSGAPVLPFQVWLLAPPPHVEESEWWVLALAALNAMLKLRGPFSSGGAELVMVQARSVMQSAWRNFAALQL